MGSSMSSCYKGSKVRQRGAILQIRVMGLENAGKTSIINFIKNGTHNPKDDNNVPETGYAKWIKYILKKEEGAPQTHDRTATLHANGDAETHSEFDMEWASYKHIRMLLWVSNSEVLKWVEGESAGPNAVILVVDGADKEKFPQVRQYLANHLEHSVNAPELLVLLNKSDRGDFVTTEEAYDALGLREINDRHVLMVPCSAHTGQGITEALDWLSQNFVLTKGIYINRTETL